MLGLTLVLTAVTTWTYAGFVADPTPQPQPIPAPAPAPDPTPTPTPPPSPPAVVPDPPADSGKPTPPPPQTPVAASPRVVVPRYRMSDAMGQVWEHPDPAQLQAFMIDRNAQLSTPSPLVLPYVRRPWR